MSEISSGLVAVAWQHSQRGLHEIEWQDWKTISWKPQGPESEQFRSRQLCVLSDAEAIIAQKDAEIERLNNECDRLAKAASKNYRDNGLPINEEFYKQAERIKELEAEVLEQCRLNGMGAEREATLLGKVAQQSAALKLARQVLISVKETSSSTRLRRIVNEPLAAINEVLGE